MREPAAFGPAERLRWPSRRGCELAAGERVADLLKPENGIKEDAAEMADVPSGEVEASA